MIDRPDKMFGPAGIQTDGEWQISCIIKGRCCLFLVGNKCTQVRPAVEIPDPRNTPEWCQLYKDTAEEIERIKKGN